MTGTYVANLSSASARLAGSECPLESVSMVRGLLCVALLLATVTTRAETWPDKDWAKGTPIEGPAVDARTPTRFPGVTTPRAKASVPMRCW